MAVTTINDKVGVMEWCLVFEPGLPISPGALGQNDRQQLLNDYPGFLWGDAPAADEDFMDLNTRLRVFLETFYVLTPPGDLTSMLAKYLREQGTGDANERFKALVAAA